MRRATLRAGAATLSVRDRELRMLETAIAASIALHLLAFAALQMVTPQPESAAPTSGPISARLVEEPAPAPPSAHNPAPAAAPVTVTEPVTEPMVEREAAASPVPRLEAKVAPKPEVAPEPALASRPEPTIEAKPRPKPKPRAKAKPAAKPKPAPKTEPAHATPKSEDASLKGARAPAAAPSGTPASSPGAVASVAPLPRPGSGGAVIDEDLLARYRLQLISAARRYKRYPRAALDNQWEGATEVAMVIGDNGKIREVTISKSSGHEVLDHQAIDMFRKAKPLVPIPAGLRGREFRVTLKAIYSLRDPGA